MHHFLIPITGLIFVLTTVVVYPQQTSPTEPAKVQAKGDTRVQSSVKTKAEELAKEKEKSKTSTDEEPVITHHKLLIDGKEMAYTATVGLMPLKDTKGEVEARIFFVAYTVDNTNPAVQRPLMFSFNGGPGSASVWLHLGALGPRTGSLVRRADNPNATLPACR